MLYKLYLNPKSQPPFSSLSIESQSCCCSHTQQWTSSIIGEHRRKQGAAHCDCGRKVVLPTSHIKGDSWRGSSVNGHGAGCLNKVSIQGFMESNDEISERVTSKEEELNRAKESAMQSWLDSKPLIDELEMQKSNLAKAQQSSKASNTVIAELKSRLDTIHKSIKSKREDQLKTELMIHEINHALDQPRNHMERLKLDRKKKKQARAKLRQILHLRRQTVQTAQLTLQAVLLESDAVKESTAKALQLINHSEIFTPVVQLTQKDYYALTKRSKEKISQANWHVSVSMEQKLEAEASHELALSRLNRYYSSRSWNMNRRNIKGQWYTERDAKKQDANVDGGVTTTKSHSKSLAKSEGGKLQQSGRSGSNIKIIKKSSIVYKMKKWFVQKVKKLGR